MGKGEGQTEPSTFALVFSLDARLSSPSQMIRSCADADFPAILVTINDGAQAYRDVTLIRHAYVRTANRRRGIGASLLSHLRGLAGKPILIGTWAAAIWAIRFYEQHGFALVGGDEKNRLLRKYWSISARQVETSVVLAETRGDSIP